MNAATDSVSIKELPNTSVAQPSPAMPSNNFVAPEGYMLIPKEQYELFMEMQRSQLRGLVPQQNNPQNVVEKKKTAIRFKSQLTIWSALIRGELQANAEILLFPGEHILYRGQSYKDISSVMQLLRRQYVPSATQRSEAWVFVCLDSEATVSDLFIGERFDNEFGDTTLWSLDAPNVLGANNVQAPIMPQQSNPQAYQPMNQQMVQPTNGRQLSAAEKQLELEGGIRAAGQAASSGQTRRIPIPGTRADQATDELAQIRSQMQNG